MQPETTLHVRTCEEARVKGPSNVNVQKLIEGAGTEPVHGFMGVEFSGVRYSALNNLDSPQKPCWLA